MTELLFAQAWLTFAALPYLGVLVTRPRSVPVIRVIKPHEDTQ